MAAISAGEVEELRVRMTSESSVAEILPSELASNLWKTRVMSARSWRWREVESVEVFVVSVIPSIERERDV